MNNIVFPAPTPFHFTIVYSIVYDVFTIATITWVYVKILFNILINQTAIRPCVPSDPLPILEGNPSQSALIYAVG